jgi:hypothetical protein
VPPSANRAFIASSAESTSVFWLMAASCRSRSSPSETAMVSMAESLSACSWMDPAVLSNTFIAPSMLYSSVIDCIFCWAAFMAWMALSSPSWRILLWMRSSSTLSLPRALSARAFDAL